MTPHEELLRLCDTISKCDDRLGSYSDYEGQEDGPVYHFWQQGQAAFERQCDRAIEDHKAAIKAWRKFKQVSGELRARLERERSCK